MTYPSPSDDSFVSVVRTEEIDLPYVAVRPRRPGALDLEDIVPGLKVVKHTPVGEFYLKVVELLGDDRVVVEYSRPSIAREKPDPHFLADWGVRPYQANDGPRWSATNYVTRDTEE